ncbi:hypothetical protein C8F04DRAFT_1257191 [Mycena alexandri]|uniref:F-box domain-containing protein n=1 Tax=Mycena alexandri TaxID=1745969 RepID=A0AAD6T0V5_9AGAR|nr:hypothetical protein C8F04DRAFT_1257191 [Mycena alexandri]
MPPLPQELTDDILDYVLDHKALSQCALVCHSWQHHAQSGIFRTISLGVGLQGGFGLGIMDVPVLGEVVDLFHAFHDLLVESPHLASHVRTLNLGLQPFPAEVPAHDALASGSWLKINESGAKIIPLLHALKSLALFPCGPHMHTFQLHVNILNASQTLLPETFHFAHWSFYESLALTFLGSRPSLLTLKFAECEFKQPVSFIGPTTLKLVVFDHCEGLANFSQNEGSSRLLYTECMTVKLAYLPNAAVAVMQALAGLAPSIGRSLTVVFSAVGTNSPRLFSLVPFSQLQTLHLFFLEDSPIRTISMVWLETTFAALAIPSGVSLCLSITTTHAHPSRMLDWEESWKHMHLKITVWLGVT